MNKNGSIFSTLITIFSLGKIMQVITSSDPKFSVGIKVKHSFDFVFIITSIALISHGFRKDKALFLMIGFQLQALHQVIKLYDFEDVSDEYDT